MNQESADTEKSRITFSATALKIIATVCLLLLNIAWSGLLPASTAGYVFKTVFGTLGTASITLFAFLLDEGLSHTRSITKYMLRLLASAFVCAFPYALIYGKNKILSSTLTAFVIVGAFALCDKLKSSELRLFAMVFFCVVTVFVPFDWCPYALIIAFLLHANKDNKLKRNYYIILFSVAFSLVSAVIWIMSGTELFGGIDRALMNISLLGCMLPLPLISSYNGKRGASEKKVYKFLFYLTYPLILLGIIGTKFLISLL